MARAARPKRLERAASAAYPNAMGDVEELQQRVAWLRLEHRDLDAAIEALLAAPAVDQLQLARLKKRKLRLRDEIALIEDQLIPDIIA